MFTQAGGFRVTPPTLKFLLQKVKRGFLLKNNLTKNLKSEGPTLL
jgi:hypothetical protein